MKAEIAVPAALSMPSRLTRSRDRQPAPLLALPRSALFSCRSKGWLIPQWSVNRLEGEMGKVQAEIEKVQTQACLGVIRSKRAAGGRLRAPPAARNMVSAAAGSSRKHATLWPD